MSKKVTCWLYSSLLLSRNGLNKNLYHRNKVAGQQNSVVWQVLHYMGMDNITNTYATLGNSMSHLGVRNPQAYAINCEWMPQTVGNRSHTIVQHTVCKPCLCESNFRQRHWLICLVCNEHFIPSQQYHRSALLHVLLTGISLSSARLLSSTANKWPALTDFHLFMLELSNLEKLWLPGRIVLVYDVTNPPKLGKVMGTVNKQLKTHNDGTILIRQTRTAIPDWLNLWWWVRPEF